MALKDCKELQEFISLIVKEGFEESNGLIYYLFDGDGTPEHLELDWKEAGRLFDRLYNEEGCEHIESEGGGEGGGEYCYGVIKLKGKYYKAEWQYYSYNGCEYDYIEDSIEEVSPKQKTITVYE